MKLTLYHNKELNRNGMMSYFREVTVSINDEYAVIVYCCDINKVAELMFGDRGVEFYLTVELENRQNLSKALGIGKEWRSDEKLLKKIQKKFGGKNSSFEDLKDFFDNHQIHYRYDRW